LDAVAKALLDLVRSTPNDPYPEGTWGAALDKGTLDGLSAEADGSVVTIASARLYRTVFDRFEREDHHFMVMIFERATMGRTEWCADRTWLSALVDAPFDADVLRGVLERVARGETIEVFEALTEAVTPAS
jgi:hypothetical protein